MGLWQSQPAAMQSLEEGNFNMKNGDYERAIKHYQECLNVTNEISVEIMAFFGLGNAYTLSDKWQEGLNCFNDCLNLSSKVESKYFQHEVYLGLGNIHSTTNRLKDGIKKDEMDCLCHIALGGLNKLLGKYEKSLEHYKKGFNLLECQHQQEMQKENQLGNQQVQQQEQEQNRPRLRRQEKVGGINVSEDFVDHYLKNLSIVTSAGIVSEVLAVYWELAELFDKLENLGEATHIYEIYLEIVTNGEDMEKQKNAMQRLMQIYEKEGRHYLKDLIEQKVQDLDRKKKNKELQLQEWKYLGESTKHLESFQKLIEYGRDPSIKVEYVGDICVIFSEEFCIGKGSDGTRVYLGLGKDGYGKAVKRIRRDNNLALQENTILNESNAQKSEYVVNYSYLEQESGTEYVYLILDLCEESLRDFVLSEANSLTYIRKTLPEILRQILKGLADLHSEPRPILHRDLKPSNVLRDAQGKFLIADFGISRILKDGRTTYSSIAKSGTEYWIAPESYCMKGQSKKKARFKRQSDVMNAGMVAYYVATKGKHPFGLPEYRLKNLLDGNPVGLEEIDDVELKDLLSWMLQLVPELRPSAREALKHPYLQSYEKNFDMLCDVAN
ncbi:U-box domain-containing protein 70-like [Xenia sp. Carnegie-2017]|uniref:U-box domain-containing protein 70-like n=1 Tax=Xenia sp. Carnegie-2017 TaxID=2897299 RepID=UPI001F049613|nr:U-box domain-containing protein 70-like [Xenia sp. Carnegie-2017]